MRIWSLHPKYLDAKGLVALWRETLLAKHVLEGKTRGYKNHPQLLRFKASPKPLSAIHTYFAPVFEEALARGYQFDSAKFKKQSASQKLKVTRGQIQFEWQHLLNKLKTRDPQRYLKLQGIKRPICHPLFYRVGGKMEEWEKGDITK